MSNWIAIKDHEPLINQPVLITDGKVSSRQEKWWDTQYDRDGYFSYWEYYGFGVGDEGRWDFADKDITHWMPLPELPGKED